MKIPPYWVTGHCVVDGLNFRLHGSSQVSMDEARARMAERESLLRRFHEERGLAAEDFRAQMAGVIEQEKGEGYEAEIFEQTLERLSPESVVTRNRYGAEVLNTMELCFVDIDDFRGGLWELLRYLVGCARTDEQLLLNALHRLHAEDEHLSMRLYRTAAGWRLMLAGEGLAPGSPRMEQLARRLKADPAYVALCRKQACWRARLTPKPGRLRLQLGRYPRRSAADTPAEGEAEWLARYNEGREGAAVCRLVESFGPTLCHPLVAWHDERTSALKDGLRLF